MKKCVFLCALLVCFALQMAPCGGNQSAAAGSGRVDELVWVYNTWGMIPPDTPKVEAAINEYLAAKNLGIKVKLMPLGIGESFQRIPLMLASPSEPLDLLPVMGSQANSYFQQGQLIPLDDLLKVHGQEMVKTVGERYLSACRINGEQVGIPALKDMARGFGLLVTREYVDKYRLDLGKVKTIEDVTPILAAIKKAEPNFYPLNLSNSVNCVTLSIPHDTLGDDFGVLIGQDRKVVNLFETPIYRQRVELFRSWYLAGYIPRDAATKEDSNAVALRAGAACAYFTLGKPGIEVEDAVSAGMPLELARINQGYSTTSDINGLMWAIPLNAKHPEKSMILMNLLFTDPVLINLIDYGIEGVHYVKRPDGTIGYPSGVSAADSPYMLNMSWQLGNQWLSYVWEGSPPDLYKQLQAYNNSAAPSPAMGFSFDNSRVMAQISALTAVADQYRVNLETGSVDITLLDEFNAKLKQAGTGRGYSGKTTSA
ncbi:MAG: ABC transporter substrate-binding protein [Treponema sp.]|jgi:putative aldouronate transport system substrate-binding protein|nr:ABC transporter substrate-binding protein [Treponema sp.]